jgi:hypothetical protein
METIAVTERQAEALLAEAKKRAKKTKIKGGYKAYFKHVKGEVPSATDNKTSCAGHQLVRVVYGLRKCAGITHPSWGNVLFAPRTKLARDHPKGVACFMQDFISAGHGDMAHRTRTSPHAHFQVDIDAMSAEHDRVNNIRATLVTARHHAESMGIPVPATLVTKLQQSTDALAWLQNEIQNTRIRQQAAPGHQRLFG